MSDRPLRIVIADDEPLALERLAMAFSHVPNITLVGQAGNGLDAVAIIREQRPDIAVLDIQMPGRTGLGVAAELDEAERPEIIFLTAFDGHAIDAFDLAAADYLLKPLRLDRLRQSIERLRRRLAGGVPVAMPEVAAEPAGEGTDGFWVQGRHGLTLLPLAEVEWVQAAKDYVLLHTGTRSHILRATMNGLERQFGPEALLRVHRSAMVRPSAVRALQFTPAGGAALVLADEVAVPVGPSYVAEVTRRWGD